MSSNNAIRSAVRRALYVGALTTAVTSAPTLAQEEEALEEITVTGSRIIRQDYAAASPISTVDAELFEDTGAPTIETVLNTLPQFVPAITSTSNNPSNGGQANVALRGLGTTRTLVLLDGRRVVPSNATGVVDLNLIPATLIENVEIITGGASATYGSDAIAGVVNIKTRDFTGLEITGNYGITDESDGERMQFAVTGGLESDDGRAYAFGTYSWADREEILQGDRAFSEVALDWDGDSFEPLGSSTIRQGRWDAIGTNAPTQAAVDAYFAGVSGYAPGDASPTANFGFNPDGSIFQTSPVINFTGDTMEPQQPVNPANYTYNYAPPNYLELPLERNSFFGRAGMQVTESTEIFAQALYANYTVDSALAATPATSLYVRPDNPNLDPAVQTLLATRPEPNAPFRLRKRMIETGPRIRSLEYEVMQFVAGANGDLGLGDWTWDVYASLGTVDSDENQLGNVSRSAFYELSGANAPGDEPFDYSATPCGEAVNPFGIESLSECAADYIFRGAVNTETVDQRVYEGFVRGSVFELPAGTVQAAVGAMYKDDEYRFLPDAALTANTTDPFTGSTITDIVGFNAQLPVRGSTTSREFYAEANFPLLADVPLVQALDFTVGARYANHSAVGDMTSWKAETIWDVSDNFTVRGGYQQALRAPNINELFRPATINFPSVGLGDPCSNNFSDPDGNVQGAQDSAAARALCVSQGIPDSVVDSYVFTNTQFQGLSGGNPDLQEETADTFTLGLVARGPADGFLSGFQGSIDYYQIKIEDKIDSISAQTFVERCFDPSFNSNFDANNFYCNFFQRDPGTGTIIDAAEVDTNIAENELQGIDLQIEYAADIGPGTLDIRWLATHLMQWEEAEVAGEPPVDYAGTARDDFDVLPEWKWTASFGYTLGGFDGVVRWRYVGETDDFNFQDFQLEAVDYLDVTAGYRFGGALEGLRLRAGVTNATDEDPIIYPSQQQANTDPATYDILGRRYFVTATYTFE